MKRMQKLIRRPGVSIGTILATGVWLIFQASAQGGGDAEKLLKGMADYVASQKTLSVTLRLRYRGDYLAICRKSSSPAPARCK